MMYDSSNHLDPSSERLLRCRIHHAASGNCRLGQCPRQHRDLRYWYYHRQRARRNDQRRLVFRYRLFQILLYPSTIRARQVRNRRPARVHRPCYLSDQFGSVHGDRSWHPQRRGQFGDKRAQVLLSLPSGKDQDCAGCCHCRSRPDGRTLARKGAEERRKRGQGTAVSSERLSNKVVLERGMLSVHREHWND
ncbi:hypothetical protein PSPO01_05739 [Paraphaeosphaeria sporulosa]